MIKMAQKYDGEFWMDCLLTFRDVILFCKQITNAARGTASPFCKITVGNVTLQSKVCLPLELILGQQ